MKIAYVFAYFGDGGAEEHAFLLAQKAKQAGHEPLFIISSSSDLSLKRLQNEKFKVINLPMESSFSLFSVGKSAISLKQIIKLEKIDIVHTHMLREQSLAILAKYFGSKFILIRTFHRFDQFNWKMKPLMPMYRRLTDAFISISAAMTDYLKANGLVDRVYLIENGVAKVAAPKHSKALGFIGRLAKEKGILEFVKANINILRINKLVIAGDGPDLEDIKKTIVANKLNIELLGRVLNETKTDFYKKISVLVLPSETEVLPMVVLEAYSCGLPVVAFDVGFLKRLITKDNGVLVRFPDYAQMGQEAFRLLSASDKYYEPNIAAYESKYSNDIMWGKTYDLYRSLLGE
jgi:L-malate glycosyltransferase